MHYVNVDKRGTYFPHQSSDAVVSSLTTRLSLGDRPVLAPDNVANAPFDVTNDPFSYFIACSYSSANHEIRNVTFVCVFKSKLDENGWRFRMVTGGREVVKDMREFQAAVTDVSSWN